MTSQMQDVNTDKGVTELVVCLDRSGSMSSTKEAAEAGFNSFIAEQKMQPGECYVSLYQFDDIYEGVYVGKAVSTVPALVLAPRGMTALYDAMGRTLWNALHSIKDATRKVVIMFITDGGENSSKEYHAASVKPMVAQARERGWQILFIGSDEASIQAARNAGIPQSSSLFSANNVQGAARSYASASSNLRNYRGGQSQTMDWTDKDREQQEEARKGQNPSGLPPTP